MINVGFLIISIIHASFKSKLIYVYFNNIMVEYTGFRSTVMGYGCLLDYFGVCQFLKYLVFIHWFFKKNGVIRWLPEHFAGICWLP